MPARDYQVVVIDLSADHSVTPVRKDSLKYKHVFVADLPPAAVGLVKIGLDGGDPIPVAAGMRLSACTGSPFTDIEVMSPAVGGTLTLVLSNEDVVPFASAGSASGGTTLRRILEWMWYPLTPTGAASPFDQVGHTAAGVPFQMWGTETGGAGLVPVIDVRGHRCGRCRPNGGSSGVLCSASFPWQRLLAEAGGGGGTIFSRLTPRLASFTIAANLRNDGTGAKSLGTGLQLAQGRGTQENISGGNAGFGVVRDGVAGAGGWWRFVSRAVDAAGLTIDDALPRGAQLDVRTWTRFRVEVAEADPKLGRNGVVSVFVDGTLFRRYTDMTLFPPAWDGVDSTGLDLRLIDEGATADALCFSRARVAVDAFTNGDE